MCRCCVNQKCVVEIIKTPYLRPVYVHGEVSWKNFFNVPHSFQNIDLVCWCSYLKIGWWAHSERPNLRIGVQDSTICYYTINIYKLKSWKLVQG